MTDEDLTTIVLDKLGWDYELVLNPNRYSTTKALYAGDLVHSILRAGTTTKASEYLNISTRAIVSACSTYLVPIFGALNGGNETWKFKLLQFIEYKKCSNCQLVLPYTSYTVDSSRTDRLSSYCKDCRSITNKLMYDKPHIRVAHKKSQSIHYHDIKDRNAKYRVERMQRVPPWYESQKEEIKAFYANCPDGYHVDHIIPLKGKYVSGLHVITNLQYLTPEENIKKGNKYD